MLASIRASGGIGGGRLKRVSSQEKRDRSAAAIPGAASTGAAAISNTQAPSGGGGLADALAAALSQRNKKVSASGMYHKSSRLIAMINLVLPQMMKMTRMIGMIHQNVNKKVCL